MGLEIYYPTDILNALLAAEQAANETAKATGNGNQDDPFAAGFLTGYRAALTTLAVAFGLVGVGGDGDKRPQPAPWVPTPLLPLTTYSTNSPNNATLQGGRRQDID